MEQKNQNIMQYGGIKTIPKQEQKEEEQEIS